MMDHVAFLHVLADVPVDDEAAVAVEDGAQEVKRAGDVEVADVHVPLLVRLQRLDEAGAFLGDVGRWPGQEAELLQDAVGAGRAARHNVLIEHQKGHAAISFVVVRAGEVADARDFVFGEPMIAWHPGVVLVDFAEAFTPIFVLAAADADPGHEPRDGDVGFVGPRADEIDDGVARVMSNPTFDQGAPFLFFSSVRASMSSAMTSFFFWSLASSISIFLTLASTTALAARPFWKRCVSVLEELFLPAVEEGGRDAELIADGGDGDAFEQMALEGSDPLLRRDVTTFAVHDGTSVQVRLTRTERFSRFD